MSKPSNTPTISVVTVSFNQGEFIRDNIESVLAQNYPHFEHIIVDGGSTDGTIEILKEYDHLKWTSEPDRGQSDGLNKGFARAQGDIIAWLNSDDWYAPGCFSTIAAEMQTYPLLLGAAQQTDREGNPTELIANPARTKYDLLRNWIPYAWLAQTSVFFTRELLEQVAISPGIYLDESLDFCMDLDLWMRLAHKHPFSKRVSTVLSHFRMYESNKTGSRAVAGNKECMRVFRRYEHLWNRTERSLAFILPLTSVSEQTGKTISSNIEQSLADFEVIIVDCSESRQQGKLIREYTLDLAEAINHINFRCVRSESNNILGGLNDGAHAAAANFLAFLSDGDTVAEHFCLQAQQFFCRDLAGLCLPAFLSGIESRSLVNEQSQSLDPLAVLKADLHYPHLLVRKLAFLENSGFKFLDIPQLSLKLLILEVITRGWWVTNNTELQLHSSAPMQSAIDTRGLHPLIAAKTILELEHLFSENEFQQFKAAQNLCLRFPEPVRQAARKVIAAAPANWLELPELGSVPRLTQLSHAHPECAPIWHYLAKSLNMSGDVEAANRAREHESQLRQEFLGL
jgi:glycosyltransferase involved in cell wall biosynthesis